MYDVIQCLAPACPPLHKKKVIRYLMRFLLLLPQPLAAVAHLQAAGATASPGGDTTAAGAATAATAPGSDGAKAVAATEGATAATATAADVAAASDDSGSDGGDCSEEDAVCWGCAVLWHRCMDRHQELAKA